MVRTFISTLFPGKTNAIHIRYTDFTFILFYKHHRSFLLGDNENVLVKLNWCFMIRRKDGGYIGRRMLMRELSGKKKRGRPKRRYMDAVRGDMAVVEMTEEYTMEM